MLALMLGSYWNDTATFDEKAHIPAGYANLYLRDYRFNPEHPPLLKALAGLPLIFTDVKFSTTISSWREPRRPDWDPQWDQGEHFLYRAGNNADKILRLMRLPFIILAVVIGWALWRWTRRHFGERTALMTLAFYAFSPTFLAHSRLVTTDLGATLAFFLGVTSYLNFLSLPTRKNLILAGLAFGLAQLIKFSLILIIPIFLVMLAGWAASKIQLKTAERLRLFFKLLAKTVLIGAIGTLVIWVIYTYFVWDYPLERQLADAKTILSTSPLGPLINIDLALIENRFTRPLGQYLLGLMMVLQRTGGGNTTYFFGEITAAGWRHYFPTLYLLKEPLALHILTLIALFFALRKIVNVPEKSFGRVLGWIREHFIEFSALVFIAIYWTSSIGSILNIGVRHVLPTFPFIYMLVSKEIMGWLRFWKRDEVTSWWDWLKRIFNIYIASLPRYLFVIAMMLWLAVGTIPAFPHYLSYYNILGGGIENGFRIAGDSNYDWGQDLKRLKFFVEQNGIQKIAVDYFGGGNPQYYLGERFEPWWSARGYPPGGGWFAVSSTLQTGAYATPVRGQTRKPEDGYEWLKPFRPVARAGKSIFIYQLP